MPPKVSALDEQIAAMVGWPEHSRLIEWAASFNGLGNVGYLMPI